MIFYQDAENTEGDSADNQAAKGQRAGTSNNYETHGEDEDDDDDFNDEDDDVDEGLQQVIENSILSLYATDQGAAP